MSLKVIISAVALVTVANVLVSAAPAKHTLVARVQPGDSLSPDQLMVKIGTVHAYPDYDGRTINHLANVKDKDAKVILGAYSANELLALNEVSDKDLTMEEFGKRKEMCSKFELTPEESELAKNLASREDNLFNLEDRKVLMKHNLSEYCEKALIRFKKAQQAQSEEKVFGKLSKKDHANFKKIEDINRAFTEDQKKKNIYPRQRAGNWAGFLEGRDKKELDSIVESCNKLREMISASPVEPKKGSRLAKQSDACNDFLDD